MNLTLTDIFYSDDDKPVAVYFHADGADCLTVEMPELMDEYSMEHIDIRDGETAAEYFTRIMTELKNQGYEGD